jgi:hypothetical protein
MTDRLLSVAQLSDRWGWPPSKLRRLVKLQRIPHVRLPSEGHRGRIVFRESAIEAWLTARSVPVRADVGAPTAAQEPALSRDEECRRLGIPVDHPFR